MIQTRSAARSWHADTIINFLTNNTSVFCTYGKLKPFHLIYTLLLSHHQVIIRGYIYIKCNGPTSFCQILKLKNILYKLPHINLPSCSVAGWLYKYFTPCCNCFLIKRSVNFQLWHILTQLTEIRAQRSWYQMTGAKFTQTFLRFPSHMAVLSI